MKKLLFVILFLLIAFPVSAKMLWEYGNFSERAEMAVNSGIVAKVSEYKGTYEQNISLLNSLESDIESFGASTQPAALATYNLAGSGVNSSATSITLQSLTIPQNDYKILDANLSDTFYLTLEPGSKTRQEIVSCTTVTQNAGGTATLSGCTRGLSPITPYTASTTLQFSHAGGSQVIFSDPPQLFNLYPAKANSETITGLWTYSRYPESGAGTYATTSNQLITLAQANSIGNQGAATSTDTQAGIAERATKAEISAGTAFDANNPHYISSEHATSTGGYATTSVPVTGTDGKLDQGFLDLTEDYSWTGVNTGIGIVGEVIAYASSSVPTGWLACNGAIASTTSYANLFALIGYTYGGSGLNFYLPDLRGRNVIGYGTTTESIMDSMGEFGGATSTTLTTEQIPAHTHTFGVDTNSPGTATDVPTSGNVANYTQTTSATGGGLAHSNMDPFIVLQYIIKY